jgi:hypothetical protein
MPATATATVMVGRPALSAAWRTALPVCLSLPTTCSCACPAVWACVPLRELPLLRALPLLCDFAVFFVLPLLLERALVDRAEPFRDCPVARLDDLDCARPAPLVEVLPTFVARLLDVRGFGAAFASLFAERVLADVDFAAVLRERVGVLFRPPSVDRFVVAMVPSQLM